jgi:hypothetical protein
MININLTTNITNDSVSVGDLVYLITPTTIGGFQTTTTPTTIPTYVGIIEQILFSGDGTMLNTLVVDESGTFNNSNIGDFLMFMKPSEINISGLVGYFAEVEIRNNSTEKAEMYSIASEITPSSK